MHKLNLLRFKFLLKCLFLDKLIISSSVLLVLDGCVVDESMGYMMEVAVIDMDKIDYMVVADNNNFEEILVV